MPEPAAAVDPNTLSELCRTFQVSKGTCEHYNKVYNEDILPRIQKKYLAHLVASIEEIIDEKIKKDKKKNNPDDTSNDKTREFFIVLCPDHVPPPGKNAATECQPKRAVIKYKQSKDYKELRIIIAHELGHVLRHYKIILGNDPENHANLFAFFAINGKNKFYQNKTKELIYSGEGEIIRSIEKTYPIEECRQTDKISPIKNEEHI